MTILFCLAAGWLILCILGMRKDWTFLQILHMSVEGIKNAKNVLLMLALVGILTGTWRGSGTIAYIVTISLKLMQPEMLLVSIFLLNAMVSFLIGTSFGTSATMGVVCMIVAGTAGIPAFYSGGAVMSGIFVGDRCSPISSSAMLVADVTGTDLYDNIRGMLRTAVIPFFATCAIYLTMGFLLKRGGAETSTESISAMQSLYEQEYVLTPWLLLPAASVLLLAAFRVNTKISLIVSSVISLLLAALIQKQTAGVIIRTVFYGYRASVPEVAKIMNGGGLFSMWKVLGIVGLSSTYSGIMKETQMAEGLIGKMNQLAERVGRKGCLILVSIFSSMVSCNQTLAIMMTHQFCESVYEGSCRQMAIDMEDSVVVIAPLIPWCIAGAVPIATIGAPGSCLLFACYLYLLPLCMWIRKDAQ